MHGLVLTRTLSAGLRLFTRVKTSLPIATDNSAPPAATMGNAAATPPSGSLAPSTPSLGRLKSTTVARDIRCMVGIAFYVSRSRATRLSLGAGAARSFAVASQFGDFGGYHDRVWSKYDGEVNVQVIHHLELPNHALPAQHVDTLRVLRPPRHVRLAVFKRLQQKVNRCFRAPHAPFSAATTASATATTDVATAAVTAAGISVTASRHRSIVVLFLFQVKATVLIQKPTENLALHHSRHSQQGLQVCVKASGNVGATGTTVPAAAVDRRRYGAWW